MRKIRNAGEDKRQSEVQKESAERDKGSKGLVLCTQRRMRGADKDDPVQRDARTMRSVAMD